MAQQPPPWASDPKADISTILAPPGTAPANVPSGSPLNPLRTPPLTRMPVQTTTAAPTGRPGGLKPQKPEAPPQRLMTEQEKLDNKLPVELPYRWGVDGKPDLPEGTLPDKGDKKDDTGPYSVAALDAFDRAIATGYRLLEHPGLPAAVGSAFDPASIGTWNPFGGKEGEGGKYLGGTPAAGFGAELTAMKNQIFLPMVQQLKGQGALSDAEGKALMGSIGALDPLMPEKEFRASVKRIITDLTSYKNRAAAGPAGLAQPGAEGATQPAAPGQPPNPEDIQFGVPRTKNVLSDEQGSAYDAWMKANPDATAEEIQAFGRTLRVNIDNADEIVQARDEYKAGVAPAESAIPGLTPEEKATVREEKDKGMGTQAAVAGALDVASLGLSDEGLAAFDAVAQSLGEGGTFADNYERQKMVRDAITEGMQEDHPVMYYGGQIAASFGVPTGVGRAGMNAARATMRAGGTRVAAKNAARLAMTGRMTAEGAAFGGAYGFGSGDGDVGDRMADALVSAAISGTAGAALGGAVAGTKAITGRGGETAVQAGLRREGAREGRQAMQAATRLGMVDERGRPLTLAADVGGPMTRRMTAAAAQGPISAIPVVKKSQQVTASAQAARDRIASEAGRVMDAEATGDLTRQGALDYISTSGRQGNTLYRMAERQAGDTRIGLHHATQAMDRQIAELEQIPGGADNLELFRALRQEMDGDFLVQGIRGMRTQLRNRMTQGGMTMDDADRRINEIMTAATRDVNDGLRAAGLEDAASAYTAADDFWRARQTAIRQVVQPIIGTRNAPKTGGQVVDALTASSQKENAQLRQFLNLLPDEARNDVVANVISQLGRNAPGGQNAAGDAFSLGTFLTNWNNIPATAKNAMFQGETRAALNDLATVAQGSKAADKYRNTSNSAGGVAGTAVISGLPYLAGHIPAVAASMAGQYGFGALLASPRFARWLARAPQGQMTPEYIGRLNRIIRTEPAIAADVTDFRDKLLAQMGGGEAATPELSPAGPQPATPAEERLLPPPPAQ